MSKDKGGRQSKKPKAEHNKKSSGQTPSPVAGAVGKGSGK